MGPKDHTVTSQLDYLDEVLLRSTSESYFRMYDYFWINVEIENKERDKITAEKLPMTESPQDKFYVLATFSVQGIKHHNYGNTWKKYFMLV